MLELRSDIRIFGRHMTDIFGSLKSLDLDGLRPVFGGLVGHEVDAAKELHGTAS